jgi:hypothetical protein
MKKTKNQKILLIISSSIVFLGLSIGLWYYLNLRSINEKYGCNSFDDCIAKYNFEGAYYFYNQEEDLDKVEKFIKGDKKYIMFKKLISGQVNFWCTQKNFEKAVHILKEYTITATYNLSENTENDKYNEEAGFVNAQLDNIIGQMMISGIEKNKIKNYAKSYKPIVVGNENHKSLLGNYNSYLLSNQPYEDAIKRIENN